MSSNKAVNNNITMSSHYSIFSHLRNDSDSENEEIKISTKDIKKEPVKEEVHEDKPKYVIKKKYNKSSEEDTTAGGGWTSVSYGKNKKPSHKSKYNDDKSSGSSKSNYTPSITSFNNKKKDSDNHQELAEESQDEKLETIIDKDNIEKEMRELKLQNKWYVWIHEIDSKDWSAKSYKIVHTIESLWDFWQFFNYTHLLNQWKFNFFIMKSSSHPTWEHSTNRNGGTCSIRIDIGQSIEIIEQLSILLVNESLTDEINDINGISFAAKGNWCVIKIWNRDYKNNISNQIPSYLRKIYPAISIKYKENIPEY
jgi:hypothetical protein